LVRPQLQSGSLGWGNYSFSTYLVRYSEALLFYFN
jgi:hypothetical protein